MIKLEPMKSILPGTNAFRHDWFNMGQFLTKNVTIMFGAHEDQRASYLIVINVETGERVKLWFGPGHQGVWNEAHRDSRDWLESIEEVTI